MTGLLGRIEGALCEKPDCRMDDHCRTGYLASLDSQCSEPYTVG